MRPSGPTQCIPIVACSTKSARSLLAPPQLRFHLLADGDLRLEPLGLLLKGRDLPQTIVRVDQRAIALSGNDARMLGADITDQRREGLHAEAMHRVGTEEGEGIGCLQIVPERF